MVRRATGEARVRPGELCAWKGASMLVVDTGGDMGGDGLGGFYFHGTRFLQTMTLDINGEPPHRCSRGMANHDTLEIALIYPEVKSGGTGGSGSGMIEKQHGVFERSLSCVMRLVVHPCAFEVELSIVNAWEDRARLSVGWVLDCDFQSLDDIQNRTHHDRGEVSTSEQERGVRFALDNDRLGFATSVELSGPPGRWQPEAGRLGTDLVIDKGSQARLRLHVRAEDPHYSLTDEQQRERERCLDNWRRGLCVFDNADEHPFTRICAESIELVGASAGLDGSADEWMAPLAGYPLYPFLFGRDALTATWMIALYDHGQSLDHSLTRLARLQGSVEEPWRDEQPGRIIQQARTDVAARLGETPFSRYYGDYASALMYVISLAFHYVCTGDLKAVRRHWDACRAILRWAEREGDADRDGYLEYLTRSPMGPRNQGWKDSENAVVYEDGTLVGPPVATCELQGYYHAALQTAAAFSFLFGARRDGAAYYKRAAALKERFNRDFWVAEEGYIGFALDAHKRLVRGKTSNMGHCLATGIVENRKVPAVVKALFGSDMFSGWGMRTLSSGHRAYNPLSYHLGSVWLVENATIALGLRRYGYTYEALRIVEAAYDLAMLWHGNQVPECVGGYDRSAFAHPGAFPKANVPQLWNAASFGMFVQVLLGMQPMAPLKTLFVDPVLPEWLPGLTLRSLRIGDATVGIRFSREESGQTAYKVIEKTGTLHVLRQPPANSLSSTAGGRMVALVKGFIFG